MTFESVDGERTTQAWRFTPRQFRRTLAWQIARQPFGLVAGARQYQQVSVAVFAGYAGTSESGFRAEVEKERAEAQLDDIIERYEDDLQGRAFTGGAAARLKADFARIRAELGDFPGRRADRARVREMLRVCRAPTASGSWPTARSTRFTRTRRCASRTATRRAR